MTPTTTVGLSLTVDGRNPSVLLHLSINDSISLIMKIIGVIITTVLGHICF